VDKFIARENIRHFCDRLETETEPAARSLLHRLLLAEEDKLGHNSEALRLIETHIARGKEHVNRQQVLVASEERDGRDTASAGPAQRLHRNPARSRKPARENIDQAQPVPPVSFNANGPGGLSQATHANAWAAPQRASWSSH